MLPCQGTLANGLAGSEDSVVVSGCNFTVVRCEGLCGSPTEARRERSLSFLPGAGLGSMNSIL